MILNLSGWKSTIGSILTATLATTAAFLTPPLNSLISAQHVLWIGAFQIVGKIWIGLITNDAGTTLATVPGKSDPVLVPSHEVPDYPLAQPVVAKSSEVPKP